MSADPAQAPSRPPPIGAILVLGLACFLYLGMAACLSDLRGGGGDAFGRGLAAAFAFLFGMVLWLMLGVLLLIGWIKGEMPPPAAIAVAVLWPLSGFAAAITVDSGWSPTLWLYWVPMLLPPPIAAFALWARLPQLHRVLEPDLTSTVLLGLILLLTAAPMPQYIASWVRAAAENAREQAASKAAQAQEAERRRETLARFHKLTADSPLWEWAGFFGKDKELDKEAVADARQLTHRQADAEAALRQGMGFPLVEYGRLDLEATPAFCAAAGNFLRQEAVAHPALTADAEYELAVLPYLEANDMGAIEWLTRHCDIDDGVAQIRDTIESYKPTSRDGTLALLAWRRGNGFYNRYNNDRAIAEYDAAIALGPANEQFLRPRHRRLQRGHPVE